MIYLNDLPLIVTGPGEYRTRCGGRVTIHKVEAEGPPELTTFRAKGSIWRMFRGKLCPRTYSIWHVSGRAFPHQESGSDIVGPWTDD